MDRLEPTSYPLKIFFLKKLESKNLLWNWIAGGMGFLTLPLGSMISGLVTGKMHWFIWNFKNIFEPKNCIFLFLPSVDPIGRKYSMLLANIPFTCGWIMLYKASDVTMIYSGLAVLGVSYGVAESAVITYLGKFVFILYNKTNYNSIWIVFSRWNKVSLSLFNSGHSVRNAKSVKWPKFQSNSNLFQCLVNRPSAVFWYHIRWLVEL